MSKRNRKRYTDEFRASAVLMLAAAGYPETKGALARTATHLKVPPSTLKGWYTADRNPPPAELRDEKKLDLVAMIRAEIGYALNEAGNARMDANYRDLIVGTGILVDKLQLLTNEPTENVKQTIQIERDAQDHDTFANAARRANVSRHNGNPLQLPVNGAAMGKNGSRPKTCN